MSFDRYKRRWYWAAQLLLWLVFFSVQQSVYIDLLTPQPTDAEAERAIAWTGAQALAGLLLTHGLRTLLVRTGLLSARLGWQLLVLVLSKILLSISYYGLLIGLSHVLEPPRERPIFPATQLLPPPMLDQVYEFVIEHKPGVVESSHRTWSYYTAVWVLSYLFIVAAERRSGAELRRAQAEADLSRAQLELLHRQINPHFLFNTLNSIRALALLDPHRTRTALTQLADLLRYSLRPPDAAPFLPLGEELAAVRDYLALEQTRFGPDRLHVRCDVPAELLTWPVPPVALLTLVENAIKHGINATLAGGTLELHAAQLGPALIVTVRQPGHLAALGGHPVLVGSGLGLANTRQRLHVLYGEAAALSLVESPPGTVTATLRVPPALSISLPAHAPHPYPAPAAHAAD